MPLRSKALTLQTPGERSAPLQMQGHWHLLQLVARENAVPRDFVEVREQLERELQQARAPVAFRQLLAQQRQALGVEVHDAALAQFEPPVPTPVARPTVRAGTITRLPQQAGEKSTTPMPFCNN